MSNVENITKVYLLGVPLENDYKNTLYFTNKESQHDYFISKKKKEYTDFSYQRKDNVIRVPDHIDTINTCNYVMYQNSYYSNKWFYAFIKEFKYINDGCTEITIQTDVIQTWLFDYNLKPSFVEREHVSDDTIGIHTVPEVIETGDYMVSDKVSSNIGDGVLVLSTTYDFINKKQAGSKINGVYQGVDYYIFKEDGNPHGLPYFLNAYEELGKSDAVVGLFIVPKSMFNYENITWDTIDVGGLGYYPYKKITDDFLKAEGAINIGDVVINKPYENIDGYVPRNNKLFTYPYQYLMGSNHNGANAIYKYEYFTPSAFSFGIEGVVTPGGSIRSYPKMYKGIDKNYDEGLSCGKFPICSWSTDMYTNWLTQNSVNIGLSLLSGAGQVVAGAGMAIATGGVGLAVGGGGIVGGVSTIANTLAQVHQQSFVPPQAEGNLNCGDVTYSMGINEFTFYKMNIKAEFAKIADKYFDMFGYKVNMVKVPNKAHRSRWWFTKTIDVNIDGDIPNDDMSIIKSCYDKGITFWRNASEIQNYDLTNNITITE